MPVGEPTPNLLAASRMRLQEALETTQPGGFWQRVIFEPGTWLRQIRMAPALAAVIFIVGFGGGIGATYNFLANRPPIVDVVNDEHSKTPTAEASIAVLRSLTQEPASIHVTTYDHRLLPQ